MSNDDTQRAWDYHNRTKHSSESVRRSAHYLDWANQPLLFKAYRDLEPIPLPSEITPTGVTALEAIAAPEPAPTRYHAAPALRDVAYLLYFSAGITKRRNYPGGEILFRAAACTGALYEIELYLVCGPLADLPAGVYHFSSRDHALRRLREGDFRGVVAAAPVTVIATGTYWRNAWKYQARTYRHFGWDNGTIHANLLAAAAAAGLPARLVCGFVDAEINRLLALDANREVALTMVALGESSAAPVPIAVPALDLETLPLSNKEVDYPAMREMHLASSLESPPQAAAWREKHAGAQPVVLPASEVTPLTPLAGDEIPRDSLEDVILRRGSTRQFRRDPVTFAQLSTILDCAMTTINADFSTPGSPHLNDLYLIVNAVEGLPAGAYFYRAADRALERLKAGDFRDQAAYLALEQELPGDAAVAVFFLADLHRLLARFGNRGYRAVQLEAGILGGRMYLGAYAQRLGATGLTFYDDDVVGFFSPHAAGKSAIFLVALGHSALRAGPRTA